MKALLVLLIVLGVWAAGCANVATSGSPKTIRFATAWSTDSDPAAAAREAYRAAVEGLDCQPKGLIFFTYYETAGFDPKGDPGKVSPDPAAEKEVAEAIEAELIDLNDTAPYDDFAQTAVGDGAFIYDRLTFNHVLEDVNAFVSVSKMKNHYCCGVTHTMKNLIGLVPARFYRLSEQDNYRSAFHGEGDAFSTRLPRVIMDLNRARPIHLGLIDGIKTAQGGEGPWIGTISPIAPGVLIAGKDVVATDAVATAAMGYDPTIEPPHSPFLRSDNHLNLAHELGLGTNHLDEIEVVGPSINDVVMGFEPCWD